MEKLQIILDCTDKNLLQYNVSSQLNLMILGFVDIMI